METIDGVVADETITLNSSPQWSSSNLEPTNTNNTIQNPIPHFSFQSDMIEPYFMHPSDNLGHAISSHSLTNNYHSWSRSIKYILRAKNKLGFIDGTLIRPTILNQINMAWDYCNTFLMVWIINSIEPDIADGVLWIESSQESWKDLKDHYL